ncbi:MAG: 2-oxo acid dehydrogenase subunit E2 [Phycisphaerae bacterium]|nr:2-oxo acid dehydrogenase subunit E2 [Phycisphaerae bacterium]
MSTIKLPQKGKAMLSGTIVQWYKSQGDSVAAGDILVRIEAEDSFIDIEAATDGVLQQVIAQQGVTVAVNEPIAELGSSDGATQEQKPMSTDDKKNVAVELPQGAAVILLPQVGNDMEEGTIVSWKVAEGDAIEVGQVLYEVETDKASIEIEAEIPGRLSRIVVPDGECTEIKTPVAYLGDDDAQIDAYIAATKKAAPAKPAAAAPAPAPAPKPAPAASPAPAPAAAPVAVAPTANGRVKASPAARRIAAQRGVNIASVATGSGPGGRIISTDVPAAAMVSAGKPLPAAALPVTAPIGEPAVSTLAGMRKAIARNLTASKQNIPHFYLKLTVDAGPMMSYYRGRKAQFKCSVNDVVIMACGRAMHEFPAFRTRLEKDGTQLTELPTANVGIAVGIENGLVVPVLQSVDRMTFQQIATEGRALVMSAREGKVQGMGTGSFTITNLGMFGVEEFSGIINPPESAILAVGAVREDMIVENGALRIGQVCSMTISCDHRIVDGVLAGQFAARLKELLENPQVMG